jgi:hypothetical protein
MKIRITNPVKAGFQSIYPVGAETGMGKPPFTASDGGQIDILRELEERSPKVNSSRGLGRQCSLR